MPHPRATARRTAILLCLASILAAHPARADKAPPAPGALPAATLARMATHATAYTRSELLVGVVIAVVDGERRAVHGFGRVDVDAEGVPDGRTVFEIGSISKALTGVLLAHDVVHERLTLESPVDSLLPEGVAIAAKGERPMTLLDLATHSSGLPRMPHNFTPADRANPYADYTQERLYAFVRSWEPRRPPGERYAYSNVAFGLLGQLLARKAAGTYEDLLLARLAKPLGLTDTRVVLTPAMARRVARPHRRDTTPAKAWDLPALAGAGGIRSTGEDMLRILVSALRPDATPLGQAQALARERHRQSEGGPPMGLGWHIDAKGRRWHNGETGGYHAFMAFDPKADHGVVVLANTASGHVDALGRDVLAILGGATPEPPEVPPVAAVAPEVMDALTGTYALRPGLVFTVERIGRRLAVRLTGQPTFRVFPVSEAEWRYRVVDASLTFERDEEGTVRGLVLHQNGLRQAAAKQD